MSGDRHQILKMLAEGKITVSEAEELLAAIGEKTQEPPKEEQPTSEKAKAKYLRIMVEPGKGGQGGEQVNIRIPLQLAKSGIKLAALMPEGAREKVNQAFKDKGINIDLNDLQSGKINDILASLGECCIDVERGDEKVKIFCE